MRIRFCLLAVLAALAVGLTVWAHGALYAQREAVTVEQEVLRGDAAMAEGISLEMRTAMDRHLFWETRITAGPEILCETDYTFSRAERRSMFFEPLPTVGLRADVTGNYGVTGDWEAEDQYGMQKPFNDVASRCPAGTEGYTETVRLRDYYETYPFYVQSSLVDLLPASSEESVFFIEAERPEHQLEDLLQRYFPIPVPEDAALRITIDKDNDGTVRNYSCSGGQNPFRIWSVVRQGGIYFIFSSREDAPPLDTSLFPLGYGVYFLPVELTPAETADGPAAVVISFADPVRVCPVDPAVDCACLCGGETGKLYLFSQQGDALDLTVLGEDGAVLQTLRLLEEVPPDVPAGERWMDTAWFMEDYLVAVTLDGRFRVVETAGETCRATLEGSLRPLWDMDIAFSFDGAAMDYDGERLALAAGAESIKAACCLALYGSDGLEYLGRYVLSQNGEIDCTLEETDPLTVRLP